MNLRGLLTFGVIGFFAIVCSNFVYATPAPSLVISQVQTRSIAGGSAYDEIVEIYNNSSVDADVTDWCVQYGSSGSDKPSKTLACFGDSSQLGVHLILPSHKYLLLASTSIENFGSDFVFSGGMSDSDRWVRILDNTGSVIDLVNWGPDESDIAEGGVPSVSPTSNNLIQRLILDEDIYQDTDNNRDDFVSGEQRLVYSYGNLIEITDVCQNIVGIQLSVPEGMVLGEFSNCVDEPVDFCPNLEGFQLVAPLGYSLFDGDCVVDLCVNVDGIQDAIPEGMVGDEEYNCDYPDLCPNLDGIQIVVDDGYKVVDGECLIDFAPIELSEILPSVDGTDDGNEYIEIYNPTDDDVYLSNYKLLVASSSSEKYYQFPEGDLIDSGDYYALYNIDVKYSLNNTFGRVSIVTADDQLVDSIDDYESPKEDQAWALIDDQWQYTNRPTPNEANLGSESIIVQTTTTSQLEPCGIDEYRNPETNRCKKIESTSTSTLVPCKEGQYRNPETNRCKNIVSETVSYKPCDEGEERNPETNRCRKIDSTLAVLAPCDEGEERNPETNRCRRIKATAEVLAETDYALEPVATVTDNSWLTLSLVAVATIASAYGIWEWRVEIVKIFQKYIVRQK